MQKEAGLPEVAVQPTRRFDVQEPQHTITLAPQVRRRPLYVCFTYTFKWLCLQSLCHYVFCVDFSIWAQIYLFNGYVNHFHVFKDYQVVSHSASVRLNFVWLKAVGKEVSSHTAGISAWAQFKYSPIRLQVTIGPDGQIVMNEAALTIQAQPVATEERRTVVSDQQLLNSQSYAVGRSNNERWTEDETENFFRV